MDEIKQKTLELKASLNELEEFKEYFRLKKLYDENEEIKSLLIQIKNSKKDSKEYKLLVEQYNSYPLVVNLLEAEEEVEKILLTVRDIIES